MGFEDILRMSMGMSVGRTTLYGRSLSMRTEDLGLEFSF